ncbi:MAG: DnaJ domain-containing protein [Nanoarchaeota archaeon]
MSKLIIIGLLILLLLSTGSFACQYNLQEEYQQLEIALTYQDSSVKIADALVFSDFISVNNKSIFTVFNPNPYEIKAFITYSIEGFISDVSTSSSRIKAKDYDKINEICFKDNVYGECSIKKDNITYYLSEPKFLVPKEINVTKKRDVCKVCNGVSCLDDGAECSTKEECGGGFCVEKICNNKPECYLDNCRCERWDMIQCKNNRCVYNNLPEGDIPFCGPIECKTNFTDDSGRCAKSPTQIEAEKIKRERTKTILGIAFVVLLIILIISLIWLYNYKNKKRWMEREAIQRKKAREAAKKEYEDAKKRHEKSHNELVKKQNILVQNIKFQEEALEDKKRQLSDSKSMLTEARSNLDKTQEMKEKIESERKDIAEREKELLESKEKIKDLTVPRPSPTRGFWEWRNPNIKNAYYPCFVNKDENGIYTVKTDTEIHKYLAKKEIFDFYSRWFNKHYPGKSFEDLVVHHVDKDISNYDLSNLAIITHKQHEKLHKKSQHMNWKSGIEELKILGIHQPHIEELGGNSITDPFEILGILKNSSKEEITSAYKKLASLNHPDKVNHLDKQFQILADSRFRKINEAYRKLID